MRKLVILANSAVVFAFCSTSASGYQLQATFQAPTAKGNSSITIRAEVPGITPNRLPGNGVTVSPITNISGSNGKVISEQVDITIPIVAGSNDMGKANQVGMALNLVFGGTAGRDPAHPNKPTVIMPAGSTFSVVNGKDTTGEGQVQIMVTGGPPVQQQMIQIGWSTDPAGMDGSGNVSTFSASFGYDGLSDSATIDANQLSALNISSLTTAMYDELEAGLPAYLHADLTVDADDQGLTFLIPDGSTDPFMSNITTDVATAPSGGLADFSVPEPPVSALFVLGAISLLAGFWRRKKAYY